MRVLITGGAGFLGSHLCDRFLAEGHSVIAMDNLITGSTDNIAHLAGHERFSYIKHDVTNYIFIDGPLDAILHFASPASPVDYLELPIQTLKVGALGTHKVLGLAKDKGARFLLASTSEVYGDPQVHPQAEDYYGYVNPIGPRGVYDEAKRFAEAMTMAYHTFHGVDTRIVRIFNTFGERMRLRDGRVVPNFIQQALMGEPLTIYGDGSQTRSFQYVSDLVEGVYRLLHSNEIEPVNIGNPGEFTIKEFAEEVNRITKNAGGVLYKDLRTQDDPQVRQPDIAKAKRVLGWEPTVALEQGLERTIPWFKEQLRRRGRSSVSMGGFKGGAPSLEPSLFFMHMQKLRADGLFIFFFLHFALLVFALALLPLPLAAGLLLGVGALLLALIDPTWAACWVILSVPLQELIELPGGLSATQAALLLAAVAWALWALAQPSRFLRPRRLLLPLVLLLGALLTSSIFSPYSQSEGLKESGRWAGVALVYLIVATCVRSKRQAAIVVACLLLAPSANALFGLWQFATASGPPTFGIAGGRFVRAYGTIGQPNSFAGYLNMAWPLAVAFGGFWILDFGFWIVEPTRPRCYGRWWFGTALAAALLLAALGATFSRGGWVGAAGGAAALGLGWLVSRRDQTNSRRLRWLAFCILLFALLLFVLPQPLAARLASIAANLRLFDARSVDITPENFAVVERMAHLQAGWRMFVAHPLLGVGPGSFSQAYGALAVPPWYDSRGHAHNYYLHMAAEAGLVGLAAYLALLAALVRQGLQALRRANDPFWYAVLLGGCGIITAVMCHNLFENLHVLNLPLQLGAVWGLLVTGEQER